VRREAGEEQVAPVRLFKKRDIFLDKWEGIVHYMFSTRRMGVASAVQDSRRQLGITAKSGLKGDQRRQARIRMDEDKPRKAGDAMDRVGERETLSRPQARLGGA
jgi:hypothetical protein